VEVKIGVQYAARELTVDVEGTPQELFDLLDTTLTKGGVFRLVDSKGRTVMVPVDKVAYVEVDSHGERVVGFGRI
jgi:hypothetical protein